MHTEILKTYSKEQIESEIKSFQSIYGSIENLNQKIQVEKCRNPEQIDDYMVWSALEEDDITYTEKIVLKSLDIYLMISPKRMELLDYLATHSIDSIKVLAKELKRDYKNVYDDIKAMEKFDLIELHDDGRNKRPITKINTIMMVPDKKNQP